LNRARRTSQQAGQQIERNLALANRSMGSLCGGLQQVGFQLQDIVVELQAGQDPLRVLIQQGTQIAGAFGPVPALIAGVTAAVIGGAAAWLGYSRDVG
jgi:hypothetical protein